MDIEKDTNLKEISERFNNGTETIEDIINHCRNYEIKLEYEVPLRVVEKRYFDKLVEKVKELENTIKKISESSSNNEKLIEKLNSGETFTSNQVGFIEKNFIPKQKIKDKIQERKFELQQEYEDFEDDEILQFLQKLLQEEEK